VYGAFGRSFLESPSKLVRISIVPASAQEKLLFRKEYDVKGYDIGWSAIWVDRTNLTVIVYDYGPGVSHRDGSNHRTNHICSWSYSYDAASGKFIEQREAKK
jgi:hypothetical protein